MDYPGLESMQEHAFQAWPASSFRKLLVQREIPILIVSRYWITQMSEMHTDLMSAAGFQFRLQQAEIPKGFPEGENGMSGHAFFFSLVIGNHSYTAFPVESNVFIERQLHALSRIAPTAFHQRQVTLFHHSRADLPTQLNQRSSSFGKKQYAGRFPVKAMDQFQKFPIRMLGTQLLDDTGTHAASTMHRNPCRLIDDNQRFILEQNFERNELTPCQPLSNRRISFRHSHLWYAHGIT